MENNIRNQYKELGLLEYWVYETFLIMPGMDYSKIPMIFSNTWFTKDQRYMIQTEGNKQIGIYGQTVDTDYHSWHGIFEDSFIELNRLGYGK